MAWLLLKGLVGQMGGLRPCHRSSTRRSLRRSATARPAPDAGGPYWGRGRPQPPEADQL